MAWTRYLHSTKVLRHYFSLTQVLTVVRLLQSCHSRGLPLKAYLKQVLSCLLWSLQRCHYDVCKFEFLYLRFLADIPPVIVLPNSEECFVYSVFDTTNQSLQFFQVTASFDLNSFCRTSNNKSTFCRLKAKTTTKNSFTC